MPLPNIFSKPVSDELIARIQKLNADTPRQWGTMTVDQMLAHCNVSYEMVYDSIHPKPGMFMRFILKNMVKPKVVNETPYPQNNGTAPAFKIRGNKDFAKEQQRLIDYVNKTQQLGEQEFNGKSSHSFGVMNAQEWNNMFYKHLDHHLRQFGA